MRLALFLLLVFSIVSAKVVAPTIIEQRDLGTVSLNEFTYSISADCTAGTVRLFVMDEENKPVKDAPSYLKYIDFSQPLISSAESDKDGFTLHKLPGNVKLMRGLFVLVIEKNGYRNKEIHFYLNRCFSDEEIPFPPVEPEEPEELPEPEPEPTPIPEPLPPVEEPEINETNVSTNETAEEIPDIPKVCPFTLVLLMLFKFVKQ
jgi:outer membrane biosynthesis protein TonB